MPPLGEIGTEYSEKRVSFQNPSFQGHATFSLWIPPGAVVTMDDFSLLPASNFHGWRKDVIDLIVELKPGVTRFLAAASLRSMTGGTAWVRCGSVRRKHPISGAA